MCMTPIRMNVITVSELCSNHEFQNINREDSVEFPAEA